MSNTYINRPIADAILSDHHKVVIVEGARAVGKTKLAQQQLVREGFDYCTLADDTVYRYASTHPSSWFKTLPSKVIIDEAQRVKELPLLVKEAADRSIAHGPQYILTGSASIGRSSLDGQDPLVRRAGRFTVSPLTQREIRGVPASIIDDLWNGTIDESFRGLCPRDELVRMMSVGGFPQYVMNASIISPNERSLSIRADITSILGDTVVPGERLDSYIADAVLQSVLALPGNILNVNRIAKTTGRDARTVTSYLSALVNRFLIRPLRNQKLAAAKQVFTRAKIHPVDPSFSIEAFLRSGKDVIADPVLFGYMFESFVASQLLPAIEWSSIHPNAFFWREAGSSPKEVDFVFMRDGRALGVEVKSSDSIDHGDFKNLHALAAQQDLVRGFVVYAGSAVIRESENMWALPVDALWREGAFENREVALDNVSTSVHSLMRVTSETPGRSDMGLPSAANIFLSYNHADNEHLDNGIIRFVENIIEEYEFSYGETLSLFVDTQSIKWGEDWRKALDRGIEATNFLMPAVTPRYIRSASCRDELFKFFDRIEGTPSSHVLSMIWQPVDGMSLDVGAEKARKIIEDHQYLDLAGIRDLPPSDKAYKAKVRKAAMKLYEAIEEQKSRPEPAAADAPSAAGEEEGLLEQLDEVNANIEILQSSIARALEDADRLAGAMNAHPAPSSPKPGVFSAWGAGVARAVQDDVAQLSKDLDDVEHAWSPVRKFMGTYMGIAPSMGWDATDAMATSLLQLRQQLTLPPDMDLLASQISALQTMSPRLKPLARTMGRLLDVLRGIVSSIEELIESSERS